MKTEHSTATSWAGRQLRVIAAIMAMGVMLAPAIADPGADLDLNSYNGKVVILDFWASWCVPCRRSFPWLNEMHSKYSDQGLVIVGVNLDNDTDEAARFLEEFPADFEIYYDRERSLARSFEVKAMPSSYVIGRDGELFKKHLGFKVKRQNEYEAAILSALRNTGGTE